MQEIASKGICLNAAAPGYIGADMTQALPDGWREKIKKQIPLEYIVAPRDVVKIVTFLWRWWIFILLDKLSK
ncbi:3-oxoacyl-(acyl-carrier-protein) reductase [Listeria fleischmannii subsp. coloradonensis]|uniref:SDR family oxidoreductase n=1 Tax=Listeria fleischmannii TaxID=1069827 RepID=A0A841YBH2_9LIST|nr:3-oxoacyl-(acyl-carrier-protein) reductase [Listeria fleischmannii subsp. coloradonensis]MBC1397623.1 SDR family oxidoreductase [Listeria fleischmannii]MBC1426836.1 SDR family oxidoreductase [Listeria fleischmannii]